MASISVVLLGLNPETRIRPIIEYLKSRGVEAGAVPELLLKHPRIFEYKVSANELCHGRAPAPLPPFKRPRNTAGANSETASRH
jgi:hypothetical protein